MECVMKLNSAQVEHTLMQFEAQVIPEDHPLVPKLNELFGDHTFFLDGNGLNVVEPNESIEAGPPAGTGGNVANWSDAQMTSLTPPEPEPTGLVVILGSHDQSIGVSIGLLTRTGRRTDGPRSCTVALSSMTRRADLR